MQRFSRFRICPVMIGRDAALAHLDACARALEAGHGRAVFVAGEAGIGKSRLLSDLKGRFAARYPSGAILEGHAFDTDRTLPYAPVTDLLRSVLAGADASRLAALLMPYAGELVKLAPELASAGVEPTAALDGEQERRRLAHAVNRCLLDIASENPALVIFEDLHWSDDASLELIAHLSRKLGEAPLLLVMTYRDDEMHPALSHLLATLERERLATGVFLEPLGRGEIDAMLEAMLGGRSPLHLDLRDELWALTEGNPFFIEELLQSVDPEDLARGAGGARTALGGDRQVPHSVRDAVARRLDELSPGARRVALVAAAAGRRFEFPLLERVTRRSEAELLDAIRELLAAQLVVEESADRFAFRHALTREAIYGQMLLRERRALHREIAETLAVHDDGDALRLAELAYHAYEAGMWTEALEYSRRMGEQAQLFNDSRAAIEHFSRGLAAAGELGVEPPVGLYLARGRAHAAAGKFDEALADQQAALARARAAGDGAAEWQALLNLGMLWAERDYRRTGEYYRQAHDLVLESSEDLKRAASLNALGNWRLNLEQPEEALACHGEALDIFRQHGDTRGVAGTLDLLGMASYLSGNLIGGTEHFRQAREMFEAQGDMQGLASCLATLTMRGATLQTNTMAVPAGSLDDCLQDGRRALEIARASGWRAGEAYALWLLGFALGARGEPAQALEAAGAALEIAGEIEHHQWLTSAHCALGAVHLDLLNLDDARAHFRRALGLARDINSRHWLRAAAGLLASSHIEGGDLPGARETIDAVLTEDLPRQTLSQRLVWCAWAELAIASGGPEEALAALDEMIAISPNAAGQPLLRLTYLRGRALAALGRRDAAVREFEAALEVARMQRAAGMEWRIRLELAEAHRAAGDASGAERQRAAAARIVLGLAARARDERLAGHLQAGFAARAPELGTRTPLQRAKLRYDGVTARQREVAALIARGATNREIAAALSISERTVESHITNILATLGHTSRAQIAAWAVAKGLLTDSQAEQRR